MELNVGGVCLSSKSKETEFEGKKYARTTLILDDGKDVFAVVGSFLTAESELPKRGVKVECPVQSFAVPKGSPIEVGRMTSFKVVK